MAAGGFWWLCRRLQFALLSVVVHELSVVSPAYPVVRCPRRWQYLVESIRQFPEQEEFLGMVREAGFSLASYTNLSLGVVAIHSGFKLPLPLHRAPTTPASASVGDKE
jgi:hypothetical protein